MPNGFLWAKDGFLSANEDNFVFITGLQLGYILEKKYLGRKTDADADADVWNRNVDGTSVGTGPINRSKIYGFTTTRQNWSKLERIRSCFFIIST